jgi:tRNA 2-thiocytidine biosynthesis protein TtcA
MQPIGWQPEDADDAAPVRLDVLEIK